MLESFPLPSAGSVVDERYRVTRLIGSGGMGAVFEAEQINVGRRCALKFLRAELACGSRNAARFRRESRLLGKLEHEHLTAVLDSGTYLGKSPYLVMEYLEGRTLKEVLEDESSLPLAMTLEIMLQACRGMAYVHGQGIIHRDLKPANLMLVTRSDGQPWLKVLDFGIARQSNATDEQLTPTGADLGTAQYMSPEQARGAKDVGCRSDVYALGAIMYEALTGSRVHAGDSYNAVIFHLLTQPHLPLRKVWPTCPDAVEKVVERCLQKDALRRFADAGELAAALVSLSHVTATKSEWMAPAQLLRSGADARSRGAWRMPAACLLSGLLIGSLVTPEGSAVTQAPRTPPRLEPESAEPATTASLQPQSNSGEASFGDEIPLTETRSANKPPPDSLAQGRPNAAADMSTEEGAGPGRSARNSVSTRTEPRLLRGGPIDPGTASASAPPTLPGEPPAQIQLAAPALATERPFPFVTSNPYGAN